MERAAIINSWTKQQKNVVLVALTLCFAVLMLAVAKVHTNMAGVMYLETGRTRTVHLQLTHRLPHTQTVRCAKHHQAMGTETAQQVAEHYGVTLQHLLHLNPGLEQVQQLRQGELVCLRALQLPGRPHL